MVIYYYVEIIWIILVTTFLYNMYNNENILSGQTI